MKNVEKMTLQEISSKLKNVLKSHTEDSSVIRTMAENIARRERERNILA